MFLACMMLESGTIRLLRALAVIIAHKTKKYCKISIELRDTFGPYNLIFLKCKKISL